MNTNKQIVILCLTACAMLISLNALANINTNSPPPPPPATVDSAEKIAVKLRDGTSQEKQIKGNIKDQEGENIIGAMVIENNNKSNGTVTDVDGNFSLKVPSDAIITISYMGFKTQEVNTSGKTNFNIILEDDITAAEEVVVVGYGTQKKQNLTGAVSQVNMEKVLGDRPVTSVAAALQGAIPGLTITGGSIPGASKTINIRGTTSINGGSPLILIDNVPGDLDMLNPEDIQSVSVLKDAASAAIYGARGAFGVILITTKKAKNNSRITINYNNNFGFQKPIFELEQPDMITLLKTLQHWDTDNNTYHQTRDYDEYIGYVEDYRAGTLMDKYPNHIYFDDNAGLFIPEGQDVYYSLKPTNPQEAIFDDYGFQQNHNISASGGSEKITYRISMGYTDNDGPLKTNKDSYSRISVSSYVDAKITKWMTTSLDMKYAQRERSYVNHRDVYSPTTYVSWYPSGVLPSSQDLDGPKYPMEVPLNYILYSDPAIYKVNNPRVFSRTVFTPIKGLSAVVEYTFDSRNTDNRENKNEAIFRDANMSTSQLTKVPSYKISKSSAVYNSLNIYATYDISLKDVHNFKIMGGYNQDSRDYESNWTDRKELINPSMPSINGGTGELTAGDSYNQYSIRSGFFRFNYNYDEKYLFEANGRYDGSSKFPEETRYGLFPSVSAGWNITNESFMDEVEWINELKPRASWGQLGNQSINAYAFYPQMGSTYANWIVDGARPVTLNMPGLISGNFSWEVVETFDIGLDFSFLNNRLSGVFDWYIRDTKGMLAPGSPLPATAGTSAPKQNTADLRTKGWELAMQWRDNIEEWRYSIGFNVYDDRTFITKYNDNEARKFGKKDNNKSETLDNLYLREGMEVGEIWGYVSDGFYTIDDFNLEKAKIGQWQLKEGVVGFKNNKNIRPGDVKFKNTNDWQENFPNIIDGGLSTESTPGDRQIIGNNRPRYNFGINGSIGWKGFDFSFLLQGTGKRDYWAGGNNRFPMTSDWATIYSHQLNFWRPISEDPGSPDFYRPANTNPEFGRIYNGNKNRGNNTTVQTQYLLDASYLRIKNITLSYSIPKVLLQKIGLQGAKVFFSGENLATFSNLPPSYDPERLSWGYPFFATYSFGISLTL